jgi:predicted nucleic acid-binding protein
MVLDPVTVPALSGLGRGETTTIRRAAAEGMTAVIDDLDARRRAARLGISLTGTLALLIRLHATGGPAISASLDELDRIGFRVSPELRVLVLAAADRAGR